MTEPSEGQLWRARELRVGPRRKVGRLIRVERVERNADRLVVHGVVVERSGEFDGSRPRWNRWQEYGPHAGQPVRIRWEALRRGYVLQETRPLDPERVARAFHEAYERLAPDHGYETREESAVAWEAVPARNKGLMVAVVRELLDTGVIRAAEV